MELPSPNATSILPAPWIEMDSSTDTIRWTVTGGTAPYQLDTGGGIRKQGDVLIADSSGPVPSVIGHLTGCESAL